MEKDPNGIDQHTPGAKLDDGKPMVALMMSGFSLALLEVARVTTFGAKKYTPNGWLHVSDGVNRYNEAKHRHALYEMTGEVFDSDSGLMHAAHEAWNALAKLELQLRARKTQPSTLAAGILQTPPFRSALEGLMRNDLVA